MITHGVTLMENINHSVGRYAPSPSGVLHLGNLSSCLLAWLDARSRAGRLIFRLEDLDPTRSSKKYAESIASALSVLGLGWDAGYPDRSYLQSERTALYEDVFNILLHRDMLYPCYCSRSSRLTQHSGCRCRELTPAQRRELDRQGKRYAWKVKVPDKRICFTDGHYGSFSENIADSGDFILKRSDGVFAYQLAVSFDDMDMGISRVVRGRDILPSTARQIWLISELGGCPPEYCHAPLLVTGGDRKLSKRFGDLGTDALLLKHSPDELLGCLGALLGISDGKPTSAERLLDGFDWSLVAKDDIYV